MREIIYETRLRLYRSGHFGHCLPESNQHLVYFLGAQRQRRDHSQHRVYTRGQDQETPIVTSILNQLIQVGGKSHMLSKVVRAGQFRVRILEFHGDHKLTVVNGTSG